MKKLILISVLIFLCTDSFADSKCGNLPANPTSEQIYGNIACETGGKVYNVPLSNNSNNYTDENGNVDYNNRKARKDYENTATGMIVDAVTEQAMKDKANEVGNGPVRMMPHNDVIPGINAPGVYENGVDVRCKNLRPGQMA